MRNKIRQLADSFLALRNGVFAKLYLAETISLLGDAFTWVGLALLSYQFGQDRSALSLTALLMHWNWRDIRQPVPYGRLVYNTIVW